MKFKDIPQFPRARYQIDVSWGSVEDQIERDTNPGFGCPLNLEPDFQRAHVWTPAQKVAYIEYMLQGGEVGRNLTFNCIGWGEDYRGPFEIVDGKQRLEAVRGFLRDEYKVFGHKYSEFEGRLSSVSGPSFSWRICSLETREEVLQLYLNINAGGTPHTKAELDKVRNMLKELKK